MILACSLPGSGGRPAASCLIRLGDLGCAAVQDAQRLRGDPGLDRGVAGRVEAPGGLPQVFQHADEIDQDDQVGAAGGGLVPDQADLVVIAVDQGDPGALVARVAAPGLAEDGADRPGAVCGDVDGVPAAQRPRRLRAAAGGHDLLRDTAHRGNVEHAPELGHPLVPLLPGPAPFLEVPHPLAGGPGAAAAQRPGQHRHALAVRRDQQRPRRPPRSLPALALVPGQGRVEPGPHQPRPRW